MEDSILVYMRQIKAYEWHSSQPDSSRRDIGRVNEDTA